MPKAKIVKTPISATTFNAYGQYYDLLYRDKDYSGEAAYIRSTLARNQIATGKVLEFGSGTGRHASLLVPYGYTVHGIERSDEMIAQVKVTEGFTCQQGDICTISLGQYFDAVISLFHVLSYQLTNKDVNAVFARAAEHLNVGGIFIFDFWYTPAVYAQQPVVRVKRMSNDSVDVVRIAEPTPLPNENRVDVNYTVYVRDRLSGNTQVLNETHPMRHFSLPEIDYFASENGFIRVETEEFATGRPVSPDTWGICVTLRRI
jgi:SAM-dependent methyltransferase